MSLFEWKEGRQGGYRKLELISSTYLKFDAYVLCLPKNCSIQKHKDPALPGYRHYRLNFTIKKSSDSKDRMYTLGRIHRWWRFELFRPDLYEHGIQTIHDSIWMLSFGKLLKENAKI